MSFCLLSAHWLSFCILFSIIGVEWIPNMLRKDKSLSRYKEFPQYKANSGLLFPKSILMFLVGHLIVIYFLMAWNIDQLLINYMK